MIRVIAVLLLAALLAPPPVAAQEAATPQLKREVTVASEIVRIGDLIANAGPAAATPIFRAPDLGQTGALPARAVLDAVMPYGLVLVDTRGIDEVIVIRASRVISRDEIEARIARALTARYPLGDPANLKAAFDRDVRPIELEQSVTGDLVVARMSYEPSSRRFDLIFEIGEGATRRVVRYTGTAVETVEAAILVRALNRGDVVKAGDVAIERRPKSELIGEPVAVAATVVGLAIKRAVRQGQPLRAADVMKPEIVQRNETITLQYQVPGILLTMRGKALETGSEGDTISVLNMHSKRTVQGVIIGPGRVAVLPSQPRIAEVKR
jgi:flagella basal body P-ring formation protein FlgA